MVLDGATAAAPVNIMTDLGKNILKRQLHSVANTSLSFLSKELYNASIEYDFWQNIVMCITLTLFVCLVLFLVYFKQTVYRKIDKLKKKMDKLKSLLNV
jgi:hypothetical protein